MKRILLLLIFVQPILFAQENSKLKFSFSERFRIVSWDNAVTLSESSKKGSTFTRNRTSFMTKWFPNEKLEFGIKFTNEFRKYFTPNNVDFHINEIIIDQLYLKYNTEKIIPGQLTIGRQNIILGEGFIVLDGNPLDGSRSIYFNAVKIDLELNKNNSLNIFGMFQPVTDDFLPTLNGGGVDDKFKLDDTYRLLEQKETGIGVYYTGNFDNLNLQSYFIRKNISDPDFSINQVESTINTIGSRFSAKINENFSLTTEFAYQFGDYDNLDRAAFGGYSYLNFQIKSGNFFLPKLFTFGGIYLSGDDPNTKKFEAWDPVFSRWPKWSESFIYTQILENAGKVAYWSNFASIYAEIKFVFNENIKLNASYHHMMAPETHSTDLFTSGGGSNRGDLLTAKLMYKINKSLSGHILYERFFAGNYYFKGADNYNWFRMELMFSI